MQLMITSIMHICAYVCCSYYSHFIHTVNGFCEILLPRLVFGFSASSFHRPQAFCLVPRFILEETASCIHHCFW